MLELTNQESGKADQVGRFKATDPGRLADLGLPGAAGAPQVFIGSPALHREHTGPSLILGDFLELENPESIHDAVLREKLVAARGLDLRSPASPKFTLVPEAKWIEVRKGMIPSIKMLFAPGASGKGPSDIVRDALDDLYERVSPLAIKELEIQVEVALRSIASARDGGKLATYLSFKDGVIRSILAEPPTAIQMDVISRALVAWANPMHKDLTQFGGSDGARS